MGKLSTKARNKLPSSVFAGPGRSYPIPDKSHAAAAKSRAAQFASPGLKAKIDAKADKVLSRAHGGSCFRDGGHVCRADLHKRHPDDF